MSYSSTSGSTDDDGVGFVGSVGGGGGLGLRNRDLLLGVADVAVSRR